MNIEFNLHPQKTVEVVAMFLKLHDNKPMYYLGLMKLLYMADRLSLGKFNIPVIGDRYVSMPKGPVLSRVYDLIKGQSIREIPNALEIWSKYISPRNENKLKLLNDPGNDELCENDEDIIREVYLEKGNIDRFDLVEITHKFPEWKDPHGSSYPIYIKDILDKVGKTEKEIETIQFDIQHENYLDCILNHA